VSLDKRTIALDTPQETDQTAPAPDTDDTKTRALERVRLVAEKIGYQTRLDDDGRVRIWSPGKIGEALVVGYELGEAEEKPEERERYYTIPGNPRWLPVNATDKDDEHLAVEIHEAYKVVNPAKSDRDGNGAKDSAPRLRHWDDWYPEDLI
jgi:hypothetical protein